MAQELKVCEAYICHNEFSQNELPQKKDAIVKSASHKEEDDWWDYAAKIECYRKEDVGKVIAEKDAEIRRLQRAVWLMRAERYKTREFIAREEACLCMQITWRRFLRERTYNQWVDQLLRIARLANKLHNKCLEKAEEYK